MALALSQTRVGVETHISVEGAINDDEAVSNLEQLLETCIDQYQINIVVDMVAVPLINGRSLEVFLEIQERLLRIGGSLRLVNLSKLLKQIFWMTSVDEAIACESERSSTTTNTTPVKSAAKDKKLGEILLEKGLVSDKDIEYAVLHQQRSGKKLGDILVEDNYVGEHDLVNVLAEQHGLPFVQIRSGLYDVAADCMTSQRPN